MELLRIGESTLSDLNDYLHDSSFTTEDISFLLKEQMFKLRITEYVWKGMIIEWSTRKVKRIFNLEFKEVTDYQLIKKKSEPYDSVGEDIIIEIKKHNNQLIIEGSCIDIVLDIKSVNGVLIAEASH